MKPYSLAVLLFCAAFSAFSQGPDAGQQLIRNKCRALYVQLPPVRKSATYPVLFDSIRVVDSRSDTSRIGLIGNTRKGQGEMLLRQPAAVAVGTYLNAAYSSQQGKYRLLVAAKNLWVSGSGRFLDNRGRPAWSVDFRFEAYLITDGGYIPLTYLDTLVMADFERAEDMAARYLPQLIAAFMDKVADHVMTGDLAGKKTVSYEQIDSFSRARFNYPMDTASTLVKGVYMNVREFRNNKPSKRTYEISNDESGDLMIRIADKDGQLYYSRKVWGFCDGQRMYKMMDGNLFPLFSVYHQFYVLGSTEYRNRKLWLPVWIPTGQLGFSTIAHIDISDNVYRSLRIFRLDMPSGRITE